LFVAGGTLILVASLSKDPVQQKFAKIQRGMTREQVQEIFGAWPDASGPLEPVESFDGKADWESWNNSDGSQVLVAFENDKLTATQFNRAPSFMDRVRVWLRSVIN
jgi:hypothetical protein